MNASVDARLHQQLPCTLEARRIVRQALTSIGRANERLDRPLGQVEIEANDVADVVDPEVRGRVDLEDVHVAALTDLLAGVAGAAGIDGRPADAVQRACQNTRGGRLADAARAGEHEGLGEAIAGNRVSEGLGDTPLADDLIDVATWRDIVYLTMVDRPSEKSLVCCCDLSEHGRWVAHDLPVEWRPGHTRLAGVDGVGRVKVVGIASNHLVVAAAHA